MCVCRHTCSHALLRHCNVATHTAHDSHGATLRTARVAQNKLDMTKSMMDCLLAKATPCITDCVVAELEKLGPKYRIALRLAKVR
jgi:Fcf1